MEPQSRNTKIDEVLNSLNGMERAAPAPFLLTRINARLARTVNGGAWVKVAEFLSQPLHAGIALVVFLFVNFIVITSLMDKSDNSISQTSTANKYDFAINVSSLYDVENQEP
jgi:hypothetical protein